VAQLSRTRAAQREATTAALITEARRRFARHGYAAVGLAEIVAAVGVTKGALYHHFGSKSGLFRSVVAQVQQEVADRVATAADAHATPWDQLVAGCEAFVSASTDPDVQQIMLIDAPAVLGWHEWRAMDEAGSGRLLVQVLSALVADGIIAPQPVEPLARLLSGAMNEAALWLATRSADPVDLAATLSALRRMLESQRARTQQDNTLAGTSPGDVGEG
jgi:AcrR family transcriptional regulator